MKLTATLRGGVIGGVLAAVILAAAGRLLDVSAGPWSWSSTIGGYTGRSVEWGTTALVLLPATVVLGVAAAFVCALVFELVTHRGGSLAGALVGLALGVCAAAVLALLPWFAASFFYSYMPGVSPLGPHDPFWLIAIVIAVGVVTGAVAGACYGVPVRASRTPAVPRWREIYPTTRRFP